jgi:eukaryotic-like serine/threonine-protein kinase
MATQKLDEEAVFNVARKIPSAEARRDYLAQVCGDEVSLRARVEALLWAHEQDLPFLPPAAAGLLGPAEEPAAEGPGVTLGPYKLLEQLGEGGFAFVFMAEQHHPVRRKVALKVLKPGMDTRQVVARFEAERQALALMDHPNIAQVFDAGETPLGRPYFVMELVRGTTITDFCDHNQLPVQERLALFASVCQAVQHAHHKGVIHRDIKPSNVLVTLHDGVPVVKVIDFGIAKAVGQQLTDRTLFTGFAQMVGTPLYMSPEQAELSGLDVDTRTDVYSLGVLLYELLTGTTPFDCERLRAAGYDEMRRIIREEEPPKPSTRITTLGRAATTVSARRRSDPCRLRRLFRGELDWVVMKALEKDRNRRYETPSAFAADVGRYLHDDPVLACPPSAWYRFRKFARRNRSALVLAAVVLAAAVALAVTLLIAAQSSRAAARLRHEQEQTEEALRQAEHYRRLAERASALVLLERGLGLCEQGEVAQGLLWLGRGLEVAPADADDLQHALRANITAWWRHLGHRLRAVLEHPGPVYAAALSPDGKTALTACHDGAARLWDVATGRPRGEPLRHAGGGVFAAAFSPDGRIVLTGGMDRTARLWDAVTGRPVGEPLGHAGVVHAAAFSPDGKSFATAGATVTLWDAASRERLGELGEARQRITCIRFSPDGRTLVHGGHGVTLAWDVESRKAIGTLKTGLVRLAYRPDGKAVVGSQEDGTTYLWEPVPGTVHRLGIEPGGPVHAIEYSPDGATIRTAGGDGKVRSWDAVTNGARGVPIQHQAAVHAAALTRDGKVALTGGADGRARLWDLTLPASSTTLRPGGYLDRATYSPDGKVIATATRRAARGAAMASAPALVQLWDAATGEQVGRPLVHPQPVSAVTFSPDGQDVLTACADGEVRLWRAADARVTATFSHRDAVSAAAFSPDGQLVLTGSRDTTAQLWDTRGLPVGAPLAHASAVRCVAFRPDGRVLTTGCEDGSVHLWEAVTGQPVGGPLRHRSAVLKLAWSPDGRNLLTRAEGEAAAWLWDVAAQRPLDLPLSHRGPLSGVAYHPGGQLVATASFEGTARLWDVGTGKPVGPPVVYGDDQQLRAIAFSPDGNWAVLVSLVAARLEEIPRPAAGEPSRVVAEVEVLTGMELGGNGLFRMLDGPTWQRRRQPPAQPEGGRPTGFLRSRL